MKRKYLDINGTYYRWRFWFFLELVGYGTKGMTDEEIDKARYAERVD